MAENEKPLEKMTAKELREAALAEGGIVGVHGMNKPELIAAIKESRGIEDDNARNVDTGAIRRIKAEMRELKIKRDEVREAGNKKQVDILRKKINRLKKKTRVLAEG